MPNTSRELCSIKSERIHLGADFCRDPLNRGGGLDVTRKSERKHGLSTEPVPVSASVGSSKNRKDLKDL